MATATITSKGQTTIPKSVRERLGLRTGDRIEFVIRDDDSVVIVPATVRVGDLKGILPRPRRAVSVAKMNRVIRSRGARL